MGVYEVVVKKVMEGKGNVKENADQVRKGLVGGEKGGRKVK